jgi:hypothetical protein
MTIGPVSISPWPWWKFMYRSKSYCGLFRNKKGVIPGRWGIYILGLEIGSRNPGNKFGTFLYNHGLWPFQTD